MQFIIDGSGSMDGFDGVNYIAGAREREREPEPEPEPEPLSPGRDTGKKWVAVRGALQAFFDDLAAKLDPSFAVGMYLFPSTALKPATAVDVPIKFVDAAQAAALKGRLAPPVFPNGGTPLGSSIDGQLGILKAYTPSAPVQTGGTYVLVAMTDGIPTDSKTGCLVAIATAKTGTPSVATFAVGVGNEDANPATVYDEASMKDLAQSGIRDAVASCEFPLTKPAGVGEVDPANVNVVMTSGGGVDKTLPLNPTDGWSYDDPTNPSKVFLHGKACDALKADPAAKIKIVIGCKTLTVPENHTHLQARSNTSTSPPSMPSIFTLFWWEMPAPSPAESSLPSMRTFPRATCTQACRPSRSGSSADSPAAKRPACRTASLWTVTLPSRPSGEATTLSLPRLSASANAFCS